MTKPDKKEEESLSKNRSKDHNISVKYMEIQLDRNEEYKVIIIASPFTIKKRGNSVTQVNYLVSFLLLFSVLFGTAM